MIVLLHINAIYRANTGYEELVLNVSNLGVFMQTGIIAVMTRWAVPVFFMISGALLLDPNKDVTDDKMDRYIKRMLLTIFTFSLGYCLIESIYTNKEISLLTTKEAFLNCIQGKSWNHMWFIYTMLGIYILLSLFRSFTANCNDGEVLKFTLAYGVLSIIVPTVNVLTGLSISTLGIGSSSIFYFLMGYVLSSTEWAFYLKKAMVLLVGICGGAVLMLIEMGGNINNYAEPNCVWVAAMSCAVFWIAYRSPVINKIGENRFVKFVAKYSFGIYLIHMLVLNLVVKGLGFFKNDYPSFTSHFILWITAVIFSLLSSFVLKRFPVFKHII